MYLSVYQHIYDFSILLNILGCKNSGGLKSSSDDRLCARHCACCFVISDDITIITALPANTAQSGYICQVSLSRHCPRHSRWSQHWLVTSALNALSSLMYSPGTRAQLSGLTECRRLASEQRTAVDHIIASQPAVSLLFRKL